MNAFWYGVSTWITFIVVCVISIYIFDAYDHSWGRTGSLEVEVWVSFLGAFIAMVAFGCAATVMRRVHAKQSALVLGVASALAYASICVFVNARLPTAGIYVALALLLAIATLAARTGLYYEDQ